MEPRIRAFALPLALAASWLAVRLAPGAVRMLTMWVHETGHAATAWVCGYLAFPGPWLTPVSGTRSWGVTLLVAAALSAGVKAAWNEGQRGWAMAAAAGVPLTLYCSLVLSSGRAEALVVFMGDGSCFVLGALLMLTIYVPGDHPLRTGGAGWGLLALGALAFADAAHVWSGDVMRIPFGENGNGLSDPSVLTQVHGWSLQTLMRRYALLQWACVAVLGIVYALGLVGAGGPATGFAARARRVIIDPWTP